MDEPDQQEAAQRLQQLGLKEYEAKAFVALSRMPRGTAKEISEVSDVPRTRVYDAVEVLESKGLVEVQHGNPQQFRAVPIDEAVDTLRNEYEDRAESLRRLLRGLEPAATEEAREITHEVWALSGDAAIENRTEQLIESADEEVVLVVGREAAFTERLCEALRAAGEQGVRVIVGAVSERLRERIEGDLPDAEVFVSGLEWIGAADAGDDTEISRLLLADRETILVSSVNELPGGTREQAVFGSGFGNGLVVIARRLMATGFLPEA